MSVGVTVDLDGDVLVAIKTARGEQAVARLGCEADRLAGARHPGVIDLLSHRELGSPSDGTADGGERDEPCAELRTVHAGDPVTRWTGSLADVAGVAAALASTLADLHDADLVHGRIDASHVLLGDGGRPRLCGWSGPDGAAPADDVAAWGRLVADLTTRATTRRRLLGGRAAGRQRRDLLALADRAADPMPTRRPNARSLADAVMSAVPGATLPAIVRADRADVPVPVDTLDRIWSYAGEPTEDERWAAAFGAGPTAGTETGDGAVVGAATTGGLPLVENEPLAWDDPDAFDLLTWADDRDPGADDRSTGRVRGSVWSGVTEPDVTEPETHAGARELSIGAQGVDGHRSTGDWRSDRAGGDRTDEDRSHDRPSANDWAADDWPADGRATQHGPDTWAPDDLAGGAWAGETHASSARRRSTAGGHDGARTGETHAQLQGASSDDDDRTRDHLPVSTRRRARAEATAVPADARRRSRRGAVVPALIVAIAAAAVIAVVARGSGGDADASRPAASPASCPAVTGAAADVDGDGCREALVASGATVDAGVASWTLGEPGDLATVGDWDCDGEATAALLRPATGDVFLFATWAALDEPVTVTPTQRVAGGTAIRTETVANGDATCDRLVVDTADGTATTVAGPT